MVSAIQEEIGIKKIRIYGERGSVDPVVVEKWKLKLPGIIDKYEPSCIYNLDETCFYYRILDHTTYGQRGKSASGLKEDKSRVTLALCCNMYGSDILQPLVIGVPQTPKSFRKIKKLPIKYRNNERGWMKTNIFEDYMFNLNKSMEAKNKHILMFVDNASPHSKDLKLSNITLKFFPPKTTSQTQPLDMGIIAWLKRKYSEIITTRFLINYTLQKENTISLLEAVTWLNDIWRTIRQDIIANCFRKAGFVFEYEPNSVVIKAEGETPIIDEINTFVNNKIEETKNNISPAIKYQLVEKIKQFEGKDNENDLYPVWELQDDQQTIDELDALYTSGLPTPYNTTNQQNRNEELKYKQVNKLHRPMFSDLLEESKSKLELCKYLNALRIHVLESETLDQQLWFQRLLDLEKEILKEKKNLRDSNH